MLQNFAIIIPARLASSRLPNKPLADIAGKSMIQRVYEQAIKADIGPVFIACDGEKIAAEARQFGAAAIITDPALPSGTDRIYAALSVINQKFDSVLNLQGDLPLIEPEIIREAAAELSESDADIATLASVIEDEKQIQNPSIVKIAIAFGQKENSGEALYFSRSSIPYNSKKYFHHIGIYAYKLAALEKFVQLPPSNLEKTESLEQLRALENRMRIAVRIVSNNPFSVDTPDDLQKVKQLCQKNAC